MFNFVNKLSFLFYKRIVYLEKAFKDVNDAALSKKLVFSFENKNDIIYPEFVFCMHSYKGCPFWCQKQFLYTLIKILNCLKFANISLCKQSKKINETMDIVIVKLNFSLITDRLKISRTQEFCFFKI